MAGARSSESTAAAAAPTPFYSRIFRLTGRKYQHRCSVRFGFFRCAFDRLGCGEGEGSYFAIFYSFFSFVRAFFSPLPSSHTSGTDGSDVGRFLLTTSQNDLFLEGLFRVGVPRRCAECPERPPHRRSADSRSVVSCGCNGESGSSEMDSLRGVSVMWFERMNSRGWKVSKFIVNTLFFTPL